MDPENITNLNGPTFIHNPNTPLGPEKFHGTLCRLVSRVRSKNWIVLLILICAMAMRCKAFEAVGVGKALGP